jgi:chromosome segregation ATPase
VRSFLQNPGEVLERVREQFAEDQEGEDLEERHASLARRLAAKQDEKSRYVKLYAQGHVYQEELEVHLADLKYQVENLKLLISSVEADLASKHENRMVAESAASWLMTLRKNLSEVEQDAEEAWTARRELVKLLVEKITIGRNDESRPEIQITYRFGPPAAVQSANGVQNSEEFARAHGQGGGEGLLRGHPKITVYEVAVEREAERYYGPD